MPVGIVSSYRSRGSISLTLPIFEACLCTSSPSFRSEICSPWRRVFVPPPQLGVDLQRVRLEIDMNVEAHMAGVGAHQIERAFSLQNLEAIAAGERASDRRGH